jgi:hypothetical protein
MNTSMRACDRSILSMLSLCGKGSERERENDHAVPLRLCPKAQATSIPHGRQ